MTVYDLLAARKDGHTAFDAGQPISTNPYLDSMSLDDEYQVRKHEAWKSGWEYAQNVSQKWENFQG